MGLEVEPEGSRHTKGVFKPERGTGRNAAPPAHDIADAVLRNAERLRETVSAQLVGLHEILTERHARVYGSDHRW